MTDHGHRRMRFDPYPLATIHRQPPSHHDFDLEWLRPANESGWVKQMQRELDALDVGIKQRMGQNWSGANFPIEPVKRPGSRKVHDLPEGAKVALCGSRFIVIGPTFPPYWVNQDGTTEPVEFMHDNAS